MQTAAQTQTETEAEHNVEAHFLSSLITWFKVVLYNVDITAMCSVPKCKQSSFITHLLHI